MWTGRGFTIGVTGRSKGRAAAGTHGGEKVTAGIDCKNECRRRCEPDCNAV